MKPKRVKGMRAKAAKAPKLLTRQELAEALGKHPDTIAAWVSEEGLPVAERGRGGRASKYDLQAVLAWVSAREDAQRAGPLDPVQEKARRDHWQATLAEQTYRVRNGKLLDADDVERAWSAEVAAVRAKLLTIPTSYADRLFRVATLEGIGGVERILREAVHATLRELAGEGDGKAAA
jgi:phage terminase Nu1 subunit (DNA packaging protein)